MTDAVLVFLVISLSLTGAVTVAVLLAARLGLCDITISVYMDPERPHRACGRSKWSQWYQRGPDGSHERID